MAQSNNTSNQHHEEKWASYSTTKSHTGGLFSDWSNKLYISISTPVKSLGHLPLSWAWSHIVPS